MPGGPLARGGAGVTGVPRVDVAVVDDHPIVRDGITGWVAAPDSGISVVATAATVDGLLAGAGRRADVVLLDLDLGDGTTAERNVAAIRAAGPAVLVLSATGRPAAVRDAMRAGARGYVLKHEEAAELRAAIQAVAAGTDWVSPRLACIFATDDAPDRPALSVQESRTPGHQRGDGQAVRAKSQGEVRTSGSGGAHQTRPVPSSRRGRASPFSALARNPPSGQGRQRCPSSAYSLRGDDKQAIRGMS